MTDPLGGLDRLDRYVAGLEELTATLRRRNRRLWQFCIFICLIAAVGTAASVVAWRSTQSTAKAATASSEDNHRLLELVLPVTSPEARAQQAATSAYYAGYLNALCRGQNQIAAVLKTPDLCLPPAPPRR